MPGAYSVQHVCGHRCETGAGPVASRKTVLVVDSMLGCRAGSHRQDLNERGPRCGAHFERLQRGLASCILADGSRGHRSRVRIQGCVRADGRGDECVSTSSEHGSTLRKRTNRAVPCHHPGAVRVGPNHRRNGDELIVQGSSRTVDTKTTMDTAYASQSDERCRGGNKREC